MKNLQMKIKLKSLAAEARIIRGEERRLRNRNRKDPLVDENGHARDHARARHDRRRAQMESLRNHRVLVVRREARLTNVAYGYLAGRSYALVERPREGNELHMRDLEKVRSMVARFGGDQQVVDGVGTWWAKTSGKAVPAKNPTSSCPAEA